MDLSTNNKFSLIESPESKQVSSFNDFLLDENLTFLDDDEIDSLNQHEEFSNYDSDENVNQKLPEPEEHFDYNESKPVPSFSQFGAKCSGCDKGVAPTEVIRRANDHVYHFDCFKCLICGKLLETGEEFFLMENQQLVCKNDYEMAKSKGWFLGALFPHTIHALFTYHFLTVASTFGYFEQ